MAAQNKTSNKPLTVSGILAARRILTENNGPVKDSRIRWVQRRIADMMLVNEFNKSRKT